MTDTNILVRCSQGRAMVRVADLRRRGVRLSTTDRNAAELLSVLVDVFGLDEDAAATESLRVLAPFELIFADEYEHLSDAAWTRLREGGKPDWPTLAAAMAFETAIWSEDTDFFGTGVSVWSTANLGFVEADGG